MDQMIKAFLDPEGRIKQIPAPLQKKLGVLAHLAEQFETGRQYSEKEVNGIIQNWHTFNDYFILRRLLVDHGFLGRCANGTAYWAMRQDDNGGGNG